LIIAEPDPKLTISDQSYHWPLGGARNSISGKMGIKQTGSRTGVLQPADSMRLEVSL
jgi:hypothetical protein